MQRRAAVIYFAFFVIVGAGAYGLIATTSAPHVTIDGPTYVQGDSVALGDRTYTVTEVTEESGDGGGGHGGGGGDSSMAATIAWTNESGQLTAALDNASSVPPTDVVWDGQQARMEATVDGGATIVAEGTEYSVSINASGPSVTLTNVANATDNATYAPGDTLPYQGNEATITSITADAVALVWGNSYRVDIPNVTTMPNVSSPSNFTLVEERDNTALAAQDPALYNQTVRIDGVEQVTYRENDTNVPVTEYFGPLETRTFELGGTLQYQGNATTISEITADGVTLTWSGPVTSEIDLSEGGNFTVQGTQFFAHFPHDSTSAVQILETDRSYDEYAQQNARIDSYEQRKLGLWGVSEISLIAIIILLGTAFLPVRG